MLRSGPRIFEIRRKVAKSSILSQNVKLATTYQKIQIHVPGFGYQEKLKDFHNTKTFLNHHLNQIEKLIAGLLQYDDES